MDLKLEETAPNFKLADENGKIVSLSDYKGKNVVLYFYPKDNTPGCTLEAQDFSKMISDFHDNNAIVIGISKDTSSCHRSFIDTYDLKVILLADVDGQVCEEYGVMGVKKMFSKEYHGINRMTFLIDSAGKIAYIWSKVSVNNHATEVLEKIKSLSNRVS